jgi:UDP-N-acetylmuramoyl-tripeptide--D-alanyl-D-alanine ligase
VNGWDAEQVAAAARARLLRTAPGAPRRATIDSREVREGDLFVGLVGERVDGGTFAAQALRAGAWGVLVAPEHARALLSAHTPALADAPARAGVELPMAAAPAARGAVLSHPDPLAGLQALAGAWREALGAEGAKVVGITGSTGKTSTKDILAALLRDARGLAETGMPAAGRRLPAAVGGPTVASEENCNTEIGLPLAILAAPAGTRTLVLEMAMRGAGQIAQLTAIAQPDVGVIVNVGPVHLQQLGTVEAVAAAKAELIAGMAPGATVVVPAGERLLAPHLRHDLHTVTFGEGGDVALAGRDASGEVRIVDRTHWRAPHAEDRARGERQAGDAGAGREGEPIALRPSFAQSHNLLNLLAAVAAARALGVTPEGGVRVEFSALRGERLELANGIVLINDCYNANPMSMRAALDELAASGATRRVAVLGDMLELGGEERRLHREIGAYARARGVDVLLTVGALAGEMRGEEGGDGSAYSVADAAAAAELLAQLLRAGDVVLVKGSRGVGLERVARALGAQAGGERAPRAREAAAGDHALAPEESRPRGVDAAEASVHAGGAG